MLKFAFNQVAVRAQARARGHRYDEPETDEPPQLAFYDPRHGPRSLTVGAFALCFALPIVRALVLGRRLHV